MKRIWMRGVLVSIDFATKRAVVQLEDEHDLTAIQSCFFHQKHISLVATFGKGDEQPLKE